MHELRKRPDPAPVGVLLADDDGRFVESLRVVVDRLPGVSVVGVAGDGLEAIELVEELEPRAVVIDLHMPLLDGVTTVARMRQDDPELCLIAITGDPAPELHRAAEDAGANAVIAKEDVLDALGDELQRAVM